MRDFSAMLLFNFLNGHAKSFPAGLVPVVYACLVQQVNRYEGKENGAYVLEDVPDNFFNFSEVWGVEMDGWLGVSLLNGVGDGARLHCTGIVFEYDCGDGVWGSGFILREAWLFVNFTLFLLK